MTRIATIVPIVLALGVRAERPAAAAPCTGDVQCRLIISPEPITITAASGVSSTADAHVSNHSGATLSMWTFQLTGPFTFDAPCMAGMTSCTIDPSPVATNAEFMPHPVIRCTANDTTQTGTFTVMADGHMTHVDVFCVGSPGMAPELEWDPVPPLTSHIHTPTTATLDIRNIGTADLTYQLMRDGSSGPIADFALSDCETGPCTIPAGGADAITVTFTPGDLFDRSIDLILTSNDTDEDSVAIPITATGTGGRLAVIAPAPPPLDFGQIPDGIPSQVKTITVKNVGNETLSAVTGSITAGAVDYQSPLGAPVPLLSNQTLDFDVTCTPSGTGSHPGTFTVDAPGADPDPAPTIGMSCEGIASQLELSPASWAYGRVRVGTSVTPTTITVINHGSSAVTLGTAAITPADPSYVLTGAPDGTTTVAGGGGMATFTVTFTPGTQAEHDVAITGIDPSDPAHVVALTGRGVVADYVLDPAVTALDLGTACRGTPVSRELSLIAIEDAPLVVDVSLASGTDYTMTMLEPGPTPVALDPLPPGPDTATVRIDVTALDVPVTDRLIWATDRAAGDQTAVDLTLTGIASGLAVSPGAIDFGTVTTASMHDQDVTTQLCDAGGADVTASLTGDAAFTLIGTPTQHVDLTQTMPWTVRFVPPARGDYTAMLHLVPATGAETTIMVHGAAEDSVGGDDDTGGLTDYYNCGCSGETTGTGGAMIVLVLAWQYSQRRRRGLRR